MVGVDAALDYPLFDSLKPIVKAAAPPSNLVKMYQSRKEVEQYVLSSHGDATRYFVTFLDNHDMKERIRYVKPGEEHYYDDQVTLGLACLYSLPGIPCLYYGTEQGLHGAGDKDEYVREALWGGPGFDQNSFYYKQIQLIAAVRQQRPSLRYGRFYFRQVSGDSIHFGISSFNGGVVAFSRILVDEETIVIANTNTNDGVEVDVIVDGMLSKAGDEMKMFYTNKQRSHPALTVKGKTVGTVEVQEVNGSIGSGPLHCVRLSLAPMEVLVLGTGVGAM